MCLYIESLEQQFVPNFLYTKAYIYIYVHRKLRINFCVMIGIYRNLMRNKFFSVDMFIESEEQVNVSGYVYRQLRTNLCV